MKMGQGSKMIRVRIHEDGPGSMKMGPRSIRKGPGSMMLGLGSMMKGDRVYDKWDWHCTHTNVEHRFNAHHWDVKNVCDNELSTDANSFTVL